LVLAAAEDANCGLITAQYGSLMVYADDIAPMMAFGRALIARKEAFAYSGARRTSALRQTRLAAQP
jgi:hypothetical protein